MIGIWLEESLRCGWGINSSIRSPSALIVHNKLIFGTLMSAAKSNIGLSTAEAFLSLTLDLGMDFVSSAVKMFSRWTFRFWTNFVGNDEEGIAKAACQLYSDEKEWNSQRENGFSSFSFLTLSHSELKNQLASQETK